MFADEIISRMKSMQNEEQRRILSGFFKTGEGEYGAGDVFLGIKVPQTREIVKEFKSIPLNEIPVLLQNPWHEVRLCGFLLLVSKFEANSTQRKLTDEKSIVMRDEILQMYLKYAEYANNWDLVDLSAPKILGKWLIVPTNIKTTKKQILDALAFSDNLWKQRMSIVSSWMTSRHGDPCYCIRYAEIHLRHSHDLMHKAVGWMLREMGKNVSMDLLRDFLRRNVHSMSRTTLRYAIEKMPEVERQYWLKQ